MKMYLDKVANANCSENLVNGGIGWQSTVEYVEVSLKTLRYVVTTSSGMNHGSHHLDVYNVCKLSRLLKVIETLGLNHLSCNLIGNLQQNYVVR